MDSTIPEYKYEYDYRLERLCRDPVCVFLALFNAIVFILGVVGNGLVIWITGFKMKKTVNTTWYLSLAVSDFLFCCTLPFNVVYWVKGYWVFGLFMCKFSSFIMFLNMFSSIFLLVIISVDRCVVVMFPVWAQNQRTVRKASVVVVVFWIFSAVLSIPPLIFRQFYTSDCILDYMMPGRFIIVGVRRFVFGFLIPFLIIIISYIFIIRKLKNNQSARSKSFKIMTALIVMHFFCWTPFHIFALMELDHYTYWRIVPLGFVIFGSLATAKSCLNPFIYAFMGKCSLVSNIKNTLEEEDVQNTE